MTDNHYCFGIVNKYNSEAYSKYINYNGYITDGYFINSCQIYRKNKKIKSFGYFKRETNDTISIIIDNEKYINFYNNDKFLHKLLIEEFDRTKYYFGVSVNSTTSRDGERIVEIL